MKNDAAPNVKKLNTAVSSAGAVPTPLLNATMSGAVLVTANNANNAQNNSPVALPAPSPGASSTPSSSSALSMTTTFMFRDQVNTLTNWFRGWNECEQTVTLCALVKLLTPTQARFLTQVLQQSVADCSELQQRHNQANNPG